jgi:hypothetical protein
LANSASLGVIKMGLFNKIFKQKNLDNNSADSNNDLNNQPAKVKYDPIIIELIPKVGIPQINFGATRETVKKIMLDQYGETQSLMSRPQTDAYFDGALQFYFEDDWTLSYIETWESPKRKVGIKLLGFYTWEISGQDLLSELKKIDEIDLTISHEETGPIFKNNIIALWNLDEQYDHFGNWTRPKWGSIGIGDERYYQAIRNIHKNDIRSSHVTAEDKEYNQNLLDTKQYYPFERWRQNFFPDPDDPDLGGMEQYTQENCDEAKKIFDSLINQLTILGKNADEKIKIELFEKTVLSLNKLNANVVGLIETGEREDLCELIDKITMASGLNPKDYGDGEGIADELREW